MAGSFGGIVNGAGAFLHIGVLGGYTGSVRDGTADIEAHVTQRHTNCSSTRFILAGYSQGAQAVGDALQGMPATLRSLVVGAALFGDPYFNAESGSSRASDASHYGGLGVRDEYPAGLRSKVFSYCRPHDPICSFSKKLHILGDGNLFYRDFPWVADRKLEPHFEYVKSGDTKDGARQLARLLGASTPGTGTVPLDLVFAIDTTGSMGGVIEQVKSNVTQLAQAIASTSSSFRLALVDYKDGADQGDPYRAQVDQAFTSNVSAFADAVSTLSAVGGGDTPESVYSGVMAGLNLPWRPGVRKIVLAIGDAPGKDPESETGFTLETVRLRALAVDPAQVYAVETNGDPAASAFMTSLATTTGGQFYSAPNPADFVSTLVTAIVAAGSAPVADAGGPYTGLVGEPVTMSAGGSRDDTETITAYDWDFDGDGTYDLTTADPIVQHTYSAAGTHNVVVRARAASGLAGTATSTAAIVAAQTKAPNAPANLNATAGDQQIQLTWEPADGPAPSYYVVRDGAGAVVDQVAAIDSHVFTWVDTALTNGTPYAYTITAGNEVGESVRVGPVTATPAAPATTPPPTSPTGPTTTTVSTEPPGSSGSETTAPAANQAPTPQGGLAWTGTAVGKALLAGSVLLLIGLALLLIARWRARRSR